MADVFVFGSNLAGRHGAGSALEAARHWGAKRGIGVGPAGRSYAIPTKDHGLRVLPLDVIRSHVRTFLEYARCNPRHTFNVVKIGCGLAGYRENQIAPMFFGSPSNVNLPEGWRDFDPGQYT